jgi:hypothetical protein
LSLEEVCVHAGQKVLMVVDISLIIGDPQVILDQQFRPHPIDLVDIIIIISISYNNKFKNK